MAHPKIVVTGAAGFIGSHVARAALLSGMLVTVTVRNINPELASRVPGVKQVEFDLLTGSQSRLAEILQGAEYLAHVASPFPGGSVTDEEMQVALRGTEKVMRAAKAAGVRRIVLTSSVAAVSGGTHDRKGSVDEPFDEGDWSPETMDSSYAVSKTRAERLAWRLADELDLELSTVNPSFVNGPLLLPRNPTSSEMVRRILEGAMPAVPAVGMNVCNVEDVAMAHIKALTTKDATGSRFIVASGNILMTDVAVAVKERFGPNGWKVKTFPIPWIGMWIYSFFDKQAATVLPMWKKESHYNVGKTEQLLGRALTPAMQTCLDMATSLVELGLVDKGESTRVPVTSTQPTKNEM
jgi:dihydroflavonol-4-reductase